MIYPERQQLQKQAQKAIAIFRQTLGKGHAGPELKLSVDEASAVHLTYIWGEVRKLGRKPGLWFSVMGHCRPPEKPPEPAGRRPPTTGSRPPGPPPARHRARPAVAARTAKAAPKCASPASTSAAAPPT